jgi:hypothetical protein
VKRFSPLPKYSASRQIPSPCQGVISCLSLGWLASLPPTRGGLSGVIPPPPTRLSGRWSIPRADNSSAQHPPLADSTSIDRETGVRTVGTMVLCMDLDPFQNGRKPEETYCSFALVSASRLRPQSRIIGSVVWLMNMVFLSILVGTSPACVPAAVASTMSLITLPFQSPLHLSRQGAGQEFPVPGCRAGHEIEAVYSSFADCITDTTYHNSQGST